MATPTITSGISELFSNISSTQDTYDTNAAVPSTAANGYTVYDTTQSSTRNTYAANGLALFRLYGWGDATESYYSLAMPIIEDFSGEFDMLITSMLFTSITRLNSIADSGVTVTVQDGTNWSEFVVLGNDTETDGIPDPNVINPVIVDPKASFFASRTSGTLDESSVTRVSIAPSDTAQYSIGFVLNTLYKLSTQLFEDGDSGDPLTFDKMIPLISGTVNDALPGIAVAFGNAQKRLIGSFQFGNGDATAFYFTDSYQSVEFRADNGISANESRVHITDGSFGFLFKPTSDYYFNLTSSTLDSFTPWTFRVIDTANTSETLNLRSCNLFNCNEVTLHAPAAFANCLFDNCEQIELNDGEMTNCTISNSKDSGGAILFDDTTSEFSLMTFEDNGVDIVIDSSAGSNVDFTGFAFTASPSDVNIIDNRSGTVTITVTSGTVPTFRNENGGTTTLVTPAVTYTLQLPNVVDGSRFQIYNVTQDVELTNALVSGGSGIDEDYVSGTDFANNDIGRYRVSYQSGTTAKCELMGEFTFQSVTVTNSLPVTQVDDDIYVSFAVDGSTVTNFTADYVDDEVNITVGSNFNLSDFYAWWVYNATTSQGISDFFGGITPFDVGNFRINESIVNLHIDNTTATNIYQLDNRRIYRADEAYPVKAPTTGGGGVDVVWRNTVLIAETGVSGLTAGESTQLNSINTITDRLDALIEDSSGDRFTAKALEQAPSSGGAPSESDIYDYFTASNREDNFKADISGLAQQSSVDTIDGIADAILADTNELQTNQGNWLTATGFSTSSDITTLVNLVNALNNLSSAEVETLINDAVAGLSSLSAQDVYDYFTASNREDEFKADISGLAQQSSVDTIDGIADAILADTNELQGNQGNWLTATGFSTSSDITTLVNLVNALNNLSSAEVETLINDAVTGLSSLSAQDVYDYFTASNREDEFKADITGLTTVLLGITKNNKSILGNIESNSISGTAQSENNIKGIINEVINGSI